MAAQGTLEALALSLARLFQPLQEELQVGRIRVLLAELGMQFPPELETKTAFINALNQAAAQAGRLPNLISQLITAINAENFGQISSAGLELFNAVKLLVENIKNIADELSSLGGTLPGISATDLNTFATNLPRNLVEYLIIRNLEGTPGAAEALEFIDVVERNDITTPGLVYTTRKLKIDQFFNFLKQPAAHFENLYDWGKPTFDGTILFQKTEKLLLRAGVPAIFDPAAIPPALDLVYLEVIPRTDLNPKGVELQLLDKVIVEDQEFTQDDWKIRFELGADLGTGFRLIAQPNGTFTFIPPAGELSGEAFLEWIAGNQNGTPYVLLGQAGGSRLEVKQFSIKGGLGITWDSATNQATGNFTIGGEIKGGKFLVDFSQGDGFLNQILSGIRLESGFDVGFGYSSREGVFFYGSSALVIQLPLHLNLGPIEINALSVGVGLNNGQLPVDLGFDFKTDLGPLKAVVEQIGIKALLSFPADQNGNLGPVNVDFGFKPPKGVGLSLDAGVIKGGGYLFFDFDREEYAGALELVFSEWIALRAIGLVTTKMPDGSKGFSLLIIITVEFGTGLQLGFGFTLLGVGGLLGLHRTVNIDPLSESIRTGAIQSVMFPQDIIANAPRIISDLRRFFPPVADQFLVGPMVKIGWGTPTLVSVSMGIILEFPNVTLTILGIIKVTLPHEDAAVLKLQVNFIGRIEPQNKLLWFYAELFDSRILFLTLEGGMGLLVNWGDQPNFVLSVGGFHPQYTPPPLPFPAPPRISVNILNEPFARVRIEGYFAVTSNTAQFGARVEIFFGLSAFKIEGHFGFDALFQFEPFYFSFSLSISLSVKVFGVGLFSVGFTGLLEGPTPWHIKGRGHISILFFEISVPFEETWGESNNSVLPPIEVLPLLEHEFQALTNWEAVLPSGSGLLVSLRKLGADAVDTLVLHPVGYLRISQRKIPLDLLLDKVGNQKPSDVNKVTVRQTGGWESLGAVQEPFALGQFKDLENSKKLSNPGFEHQNSGLKVSAAGAQLRTSKAVKRSIRYETIIIDNNYKRHVIRFYQYFRVGFSGLYGTLFNHYLGGSAVSQSVLSQSYRKQVQPFDEVIKVQSHQYSVAFNHNNQPLHDAAMHFNSQADAQDFLMQQLQKDPNLVDSLHVIPNTEITI
jgi:hypothetical protein